MAVAFDATSSTSGDTVSSISWTHTPVGTPTAVGVGVYWWDGTNAISTITYGGTSMGAAVQSDIDGTNGRSSLYGLANPLSGARTVAIDWAVAVSSSAGANTVTGSDTATAFNTSAVATGSSTTITVSVTSTTDEFVMDIAGQTSGGAAPVFTVGALQTSRWNLSVGGLTGAGSTEPGATSVTMSWSSDQNIAWVTCAGSFKVAAAGGAAIRLRFPPQTSAMGVGGMLGGSRIN